MGVRIPAASSAALLLACTLLSACGGGGGGGGSPPPSPTPTPPPVDTTPPETTLGTGPSSPTNATSATFTFTANETATFEGRLDGGAYAAVTSPHTLNNLADGSHTFEVRARDSATNTDATPASATWTVDTTPPDTQITVAPSSTTVINSATFTVTSTETGGSIEASVDGGAFGTVTIPYTPGGLTDGAHSIQFRARDAANNVDASPVSASWTLDVTPAQVRLLFPARNFYTDAATVTVRGTASDPNGVTALSVNGVAASSSDGYAHWTTVIPVPVAASTPLTITSRDGPGNNGSVAAANMMNRGPFINIARGIAYDAQRNRVIVIDYGTGDVVAFNRTTGIGQMLSAGPAPGTTPGSGFEEAVVDAANDRLLILRQYTDQDEIVAVNLATGARSVVSPTGGSTSPTRLHDAMCIALDAANQRLYVSVAITASIVRINLATGARTIISGGAVGTGNPLQTPRGIVFDNLTNPTTPRLLVATAAGIVSIDPATGNRTPFSNASLGTGPAFISPLSMVMDPAGQRVLVSDVNFFGVFAVSLANGDRTVLDQGSGPGLFYGIGLAFDPATRTLFSPQTGGYGETDAVTHARRVMAHNNVGGDTRIGNPVGMFIEPASGTPSSLVYLHPGFGFIYRLNLDTSNRSIISASDYNIGSGPSLNGAVDMVPDRRPSANGRGALVLVGTQTPKLVSVDLVTGDRTLIANINAGVHDNSPMRMALDVPNNRVLFANNENTFGDVDELYAVNLANGALSLVSGPANSGPALFYPGQMVLEPVASPTRALISDFSAPTILAIDLASGNRTLFDSGSTGPGVTYSRLGPMAVDTARGRLLALHVDYPSNLFRRPLAGGSREIISGANPAGLAVTGTGPPMFYVTAMDVNFANDIAYAASSNNGSIIQIDMVSGDRVVIAR